MTPDELAIAGRALYGARWQTSLAIDLNISDRTMRRWLVGESPIPDGVQIELREVLIKRLNELGGIIGYSVNPADSSVFHYPTGAYFRYDDSRNLSLLNPKMVPPDRVLIVTQGAEEALRQDLERDPRIKFMWLDQVGRRDPTAEIDIKYKGFIIVYPKFRIDASRWTVNVGSNDPRLLAKLGGRIAVINDHVSLKGAISKAKRHIDELE